VTGWRSRHRPDNPVVIPSIARVLKEGKDTGNFGGKGTRDRHRGRKPGVAETGVCDDRRGDDHEYTQA
jgi:hypothetical protein